MELSRFDWDAGNSEKCRKHGVSLEEIEARFRSGPRVAPDPRHSTAEDRLIAVGRAAAGRAIFVAFTMRLHQGMRLIRPVSARYMHSKEFERYDKEGAAAEKR